MTEISFDTEKKGKVWLAGAGPGDAGLLTVKTADLIKEADVIVYDALLSAEILSFIPDKTETIYVGKHAGNHAVPQSEINRILVREAKKGKKVLRLKGGDPFVFGRGGEELELLVEEKIPFEIVPGITSSVAVAAYAGIPVTHRDYTSSFHVITGHAKRDGRLDIDFQVLVKLNGTLVFLMGVSSMEFILDGLVEAGMNPDMPAAVLEKGTSAAQRRVCATVGTLKAEAKRAKIGTPAVIIVGKVCRLSEQFHWAEDRTLGGRQFLVTRPRQNSSALAGRLRKLGAQVIELPSIRTEMITPNPCLKEALQRMGKEVKEEWLVFTSPVGVSVFFRQLREMEMDLRDILCGGCRVKIASIGSATTAALEEHGLFPDIVPQIYSASCLGRALAESIEEENREKSSIRALIVRAEQGSEELIPPLLDVGIVVEDVALYRTCYETHDFLRNEIKHLFVKGEIDAVTFTSASTVKGFVRTMKEIDFSKIRAVCIGEQTAAEAGKYHMQITVAKEASMDSMVSCIVENFG